MAARRSCSCLVKQSESAIGADGELALEVCEEGVELLEALEAPPVVISVAGMYRTGKSFFLNRLGGGRPELGVGSTTEPHTRGIWIWHVPAAAAAAPPLILMDTEGLASSDRDESYDAKIFSLALLLSSYVVLNVVGVIDDATIERLHVVTQVATSIIVSERDGGSVSEHFPPLVVLVRDFALRPTKDGAPLGDNEYLEEALRDREDRRRPRRNQTRKTLRTVFPSRACCTLVRPVSDEDALRRAANLSDDELRPEFVEKLARLKAAILEGCGEENVAPRADIKRVLGHACGGATLAALTRKHVDAINSGAAPSIAGAWEAASRDVCARAVEAAEDAYAPDLPADGTLPAHAERPLNRTADVDALHRDAVLRAVAVFEARAVAPARNEARDRLDRRLAARAESLAADVVARSVAACVDDDPAPVPALDDPEEAGFVEATTDFLERRISRLESIARGPRRDAFLKRARFDAERAAVATCASRVSRLHAARRTAERERREAAIDAASERTRAAEERANWQATRADNAEAAARAATDELRAARRELLDEAAEIDSLRERAASLARERLAVGAAAHALGRLVAAVEAADARDADARRHAAELGELAFRVKDETRRSLLDEADHQQQQQPKEFFAPLGKLWAVGRDKVASVAEHSMSSTLLVLNVAACLSGFLFGYDTGVVSGAVEDVQKTLRLSTHATETAVAATPFGACVFSLVAAPLNALIGRRSTLLIAALSYTLGAVLVGSAWNLSSLVAGRTGLGVGVGLGSMTVPIFIAEVAPADRRGRMVTLYDMNIVFGQVVAGVVNGAALYANRGAWRFTMGAAALPAIIQGGLLLGLPESPRWLLHAGRRDAAIDALKRVRVSGDRAVVPGAVASELAAIELLVSKEREARRAEMIDSKFFFSWHNNPWAAVARTPARRRALAVGVAIMVVQALSGINAIMYYGASIARQVGLKRKQAVWTAAVFDVAQLCGVIASIARMDSDGRRTLALRSTSGVCVALFAMAACSPPSAIKTSIGVLLACIFYLFLFGSGLSGVAWTLNSEIHPLVTRSHAQSLAVSTNWACNFAISYFFLSVSTTAGPAVAFSAFLAASLAGLLWLFCFLPETKGVSLEHLELRFERPLSKHAALPMVTPLADEGGGGGIPAAPCKPHHPLHLDDHDDDDHHHHHQYQGESKRGDVPRHHQRRNSDENFVEVELV
ncbi:hypothetical protein CTAYLR_005577 [Chrysophaeum taylorii]|uniref:Hexose transporter 1 n=1 Tax=Chrysophaeum taylorii TaxID=2483200 RepID=A0AAD7XEC7_9STRA|nr:hypothetical protein CTAYLR_005577 [Chrysophaeum taylorii]